MANVPCEDFLLGICRAQGIDKEGVQECTKGAHGDDEAAKLIPCCINKPKGHLKAKFLSFTPPWPYCMQGPKCVYDHCEWTPENGQRALRLRQEARNRAPAEEAGAASSGAMEEEHPPPAEELPPTTPSKATYAAAARYAYVVHRLTPPPRHHQREHKITRRKRKRLVEIRGREATDHTLSLIHI